MSIEPDETKPVTENPEQTELQGNEIQNTEPAKPSGNSVNCPDCQAEYPRPRPGSYKCAQCFCKFVVAEDQSLKIVPFFDEMKLEPILVMLAILGLILLVAVGDAFMPFGQRLNLFLLFAAFILGFFKGAQYLCRQYRGVDRFFRKISRPVVGSDGTSLIRLDIHNQQD